MIAVVIGNANKDRTNKTSSDTNLVMRQRDAVRELEVGRVAASVLSYMANNRGSTPFSVDDIMTYVGSDNISRNVVIDGTEDPIDEINFRSGKTCGGEETASSRDFSVSIKLEATGDIYCNDYD